MYGAAAASEVHAIELELHPLEGAVELRMGFTGDTGTKVDSLHRLKLTCRDCGEPPAPDPGGPGLQPEPETQPPEHRMARALSTTGPI